ncbi:flagellar motor protein MotB [Thalassobaculum sp.]|uniref:flagellar motor protein MotB n=1 Tax=Thalassobaculum sp. TaxID=2022740 RepID=UPI003B5C49DC
MDNHATIVIKKVKKGGHGGHHGGAWKVAYADFVTAMMAFFLLLWLLNATTEEQKMGISNYFDPTAISRSTRSGSGGVLGGTSITVPGALKSASSPPMISTPQVARPQAERTESLDPDSDDPENIESRLGSREDEEGTVNQEVMEQMLREREQQQFEEAEAALKEAIEQTPELAEAGESLKIEAVPEGLRIQLIDQERIALFPNGSAAMYDQTRALLEKVAEVIKKMPNNIEISGHTDSSQFAPGSTYTNWELSSDRANASRRVLEENGIPSGRIEKVAGRADREPLVEDPADPTNRRISIVLKNLTPEQAQNLNLLDPSVAGSTPGVGVGGTPAGGTAPGGANDDGAPPGTPRAAPASAPPAASNDTGAPVLNDTGAPAPRVGG